MKNVTAIMTMIGISTFVSDAWSSNSNLTSEDTFQQQKTAPVGLNEAQTGYGKILTGEAAVNSVVCVKDITRLIEFFIEPSESRNKVISGIVEKSEGGALFKTNSLLKLVDLTFQMKLSQSGREVLNGAEIGSVGFPTSDQHIGLTFIAKSFADKWTLNVERLKELFPTVKQGNMLQIPQLIQRDGQLPNNLMVSPEGGFMIQFMLFPMAK